MTPYDLSQALALSTAEGWNQTEKDWRLLLENPDNICIVAEKNNKVAGTATALVHSGKIAWIGMVIVDKALRGQGAGKILMVNIIDKLKHIDSIKLDATPAGQPLYKSLGFVDEYMIFRMTDQSLNPIGYLPGEEAPPGDDVTKGRSDLQTCGLADLQTFILHLDEKIFGADRSYLLSKLIRNFPEKAFFIKSNNIPAGHIL